MTGLEIAVYLTSLVLLSWRSFRAGEDSGVAFMTTALIAAQVVPNKAFLVDKFTKYYDSLEAEEDK